MSRKKLKIVHISAEVAPYSKTGGLGDVASSLPKAHKNLGYEVLVITPFYSQIIDVKSHDLKLIIENEKILTSNDIVYGVSYMGGRLMKDLPIYFVSSDKFFNNKSPYGSVHENAQFMFFDLAAINLLKIINFQPDIIHCHDWHTGLIPYFLKGRLKEDEFFKNTALVYTIHNLTFQLGHPWADIKNEDRDDGHSKLPSIEDVNLIENINFAKRGILNADAINTVSETYREEIITKDFGEDLNRILKNREKIVFGIVNGIDYNEYNPQTDIGLPQTFDENSLERRATNKDWLQKHFGLKNDLDVPIICLTSRVAEQKGFALLKEIIDPLLHQNVQIIIMGDGDKDIISFFEKKQKKYHNKLVMTPFDGKIETSIYAGADMFLLSSRFEPCGINQMIALRYGCIPIVHHIGGLADTISNFNPTNNKGNGFSFLNYEPLDLLVAIIRAIETYKYTPTWQKLMKRGMKEANSWTLPAKKYIDLYRLAMKLKKSNNNQ